MGCLSGVFLPLRAVRGTSSAPPGSSSFTQDVRCTTGFTQFSETKPPVIGASWLVLHSHRHQRHRGSRET
uniref:Putative secreted peptide n=1 Tax=Anopheles braziliensis TaxID=58242 RepID=A0A2M3ZT82_9DIPT